MTPAEQNKTKWPKVGKTILFCIFIIIGLIPVFKLFVVGEKYVRDSELRIIDEPRNSLDALYIGASNAYDYFLPPLVWEKYGYSISLYSISTLPAYSIKYRIIEARKYQKDPLFIINLNPFKGAENIVNQTIHYNTNYMPFSLNKVKLLQLLVEKGGFNVFNGLEYYLPITRFHSRWQELKESDFIYKPLGFKGAPTHNAFLYRYQDFSDKVNYPDDREPITDTQKAIMDDLLAYIEQENLKVLFVTTPQLLGRSAQARLHSIEDYVTNRGYDCLPMLGTSDITGIQPKTDYYNEAHTNVHGAIKFTAFFGKYLADNYGFTDKRGQPGWESWDEAVKAYTDIISAWTLDIEREGAPRDYTLGEPAALQVKRSGLSAYLTWDAVDGADGYAVYRKVSTEDEGKNWAKVAEIDSLQYTDEALEHGAAYTYTVVPYVERDGNRAYGSFSYNGIKVITN